MKNKINIKNIIIISLLFAVIVLVFGFIFLSVKLENKNNEEQKLKVEFTEIKSETPVKGGVVSPSETQEFINEGMTAKFNFTLSTPQDEIAYTITIKNTGTMPAKIVNILSEPDYINNNIAKESILPIVVNMTPITKNKLNPGEEQEIKLIVSYGNDVEIKQKNIPYQITILATTIN